MSTNDLIEGEAMLDDEENDEEFDDETGEPLHGPSTGKGVSYNDSSEEDDEEEEDEEAARAVREGFIVDEDEEIEERAERRRERKKRRREERERDDVHLDQEDLDLLAEQNPDFQPQTTESKFKRLKRGHKADRPTDVFKWDEEEEADYDRTGYRRREDEMEGFIEEDEFSDEERQRMEDDEEIARPVRKGISGLAITEATGLDENALEDMRAAFGDGTDYLFALEMEEDEEEQQVEEEKRLDLKDVFEPTLLAEKMLTEEDNEIRFTDEPERHQIARKPYKGLVLTDDEFREEAVWISNLMLLRKQHIIEDNLQEPFQRAVAKVLEFMVTDDFEVPFIFQHRKDYLIHAAKVPSSPDAANPNAPEFVVRAQKLLNMNDLWDIFEHDLKFRAYIDKRHTLQRTYKKLQEMSIQDEIVDEMLFAATTMEELQDIQEYMHFQYGAQIKDISLVSDETQEADGEANGQSNGQTTQRRKAGANTLFERIRKSNVYHLVRAFGISADAFAQAASQNRRGQYAEDPEKLPEETADETLDTDYSNATSALRAAKAMFVEELVMNPRMRKVIREQCYINGVVDCYRTEKGLRRIDEQHPYYEFKYLRDQQLTDIARRPELFLSMLKAEEEGLVNVKVTFQNFERYRQSLYSHIESDSQSDIADAWNRERREVLDTALGRLLKLLTRSVKENIRQNCENNVAKDLREVFSNKLDQAPYKPKGMVLGTVPRVLAFSNGDAPVNGDHFIHWVWVEEEGRPQEHGKLAKLQIGDPERGVPDGEDVAAFLGLVRRRVPDVIAVSGRSPETRKLYKLLSDIIDRKDLRTAPYTVGEGKESKEVTDKLEVVMVNDETAQLYAHSPRAAADFPVKSDWLTSYCCGIARYLQNPLKEYASLGKDLVSIQFTPGQRYLAEDSVMKQLESALVDMVNLCGVDINDAVNDTGTQNLLQYVCGLGPRKASHLVKIVNMNGGIVNNRVELLGVEAQYPAMGVKVWNNCASFLYLDWENVETDADPLDNTRVHPEDYDIARKMAADALELDEEDIKAETDESGPGAIVRKLLKEDLQDRVNDLILEEYAEQLEKNLNQRKRATLETIRAELQQPYEELRKQFVFPSTDEIFTMLTGETNETLADGMIVSMSIKRITPDHIEGKLDCGVEVLVPESDITDRHDIPPKSLFQIHQSVQGKILYLNKKTFTCNMSLREDKVSRGYQRPIERPRGEWDDVQEQEDRDLLQEKTKTESRFVRVIKHPLFRAYNSKQAEEYLGGQNRGDCVIRPSSKGPDHLTITWKVSDGVYQHIDVLELDKENEYAVGRILKIGGKYTYSDLDELIVSHVQTMARKVDEMMAHEKYQNGTKADTEKWLTTYTMANPKRSVYAFCINPKYPGYFFLCFKAGQNAALQSWNVKVIPQGYELQRNPYPDMRALCNGFKLLFTNMQVGRVGQGRR
ncbi:putative transcription elongation factor SPT6 [Talaromyces proteolyticus]|uniref:Transcription elongation factor Spt6 n=1 Tax=Talaromyces proteolyticus TaxID=1131652 RepID=A0AAD4PRF4_9EURO|nr:putative transcription elongation factor SPT6 [Talaromyces proteolyticus]KAH8688771.1 putative transcription elongation factor SPT6 [Talaromyces proteolyticus]